MLCSVLTFAGLEYAPVRHSILCIWPSSFPTKVAVEHPSSVDALLCDGIFLISTFSFPESCFGLTDVLTLPRLPQGSIAVFSHLNLRVDSIAQWSLSLHVQPNLFLNYRPFPLYKIWSLFLTSICCRRDLWIEDSQREPSLAERRPAFSAQSWLKWLP